MQSKIYNLLSSCFEENYGDTVPSISLQLFIITAKSIVPFEEKIGCNFDALRYEKELYLFKDYKNGEDEILDSYFNVSDVFFEKDKLLEAKIMPIIISNTEWSILINEALRAVTVFSYNQNSILDTIIISSFIHMYLNGSKFEPDSFNDSTKERIIEFSLKDFLERNNKILDRNDLIEFEKERIKLLTEKNIYLRCIDYKSISYIVSCKNMDNMHNAESILNNFAVYLFKLRKGLISPEKLKLPNMTIPELKEYFKYSSFNHPLLGKCTVVKKDEKFVLLKSKSGLLKVNI